MIDPEKRKAVLLLHKEGMSIKEISRRVAVSRNVVRWIIRAPNNAPTQVRKDKIEIDAELIRKLYVECDGWMQRIHEKLVEEIKIPIGYSTLTRMIRDLGLGRDKNSRCWRVADQPGAEMQHDCSLYRLEIGNEQPKLVGFLYICGTQRFAT